jgi:hypothetical protein
MLTGLDLNNIRSLEDALDCICKLLNLVETLSQEIQDLKRQNQELRDDINRLKGEQGKPKIRPRKDPSKNCSSENERKHHLRLENEFDNLFSTVTGYDALDQRIAKTKDKKSALLMVLDHPEITLHNNPAELGARTRVRKRKVSFGTRTEEGTKAWDTFMSLSATVCLLILHHPGARRSMECRVPGKSMDV